MRDNIVKWMMDNIYFVSFIMFSALTLFLFLSPRMNARLEAPAPSLRLLRHLGATLVPEAAPKKSRKHAAQVRSQRVKTPPPPLKPKRLKHYREIYLGWLLEKIDWLLYDKLKLLPNARTGRRVNYFMMLFIVSVLLIGIKLLRSSELLAIFDYRYEASTRGQLWLFFLGMPVCMSALALPMVLVQKNREFYFDVVAMSLVMYMASFKIFVCGPLGCCLGISHSWGVYNERVDAVVFPIQWIEGSVGFVLVFLCILFMLFSKHYKPGRGCSFSAWSYAVPRFIIDYLRYRGPEFRETESIGILGLTMVQTACAAAVLVGIVWLFVLPLEKKLMDRLWNFSARHLQAAVSRSKWMIWRQRIVEMEGGNTA